MSIFGGAKEILGGAGRKPLLNLLGSGGQQAEINVELIQQVSSCTPRFLAAFPTVRIQDAQLYDICTLERDSLDKRGYIIKSIEKGAKAP